MAKDKVRFYDGDVMERNGEHYIKSANKIMKIYGDIFNDFENCMFSAEGVSQDPALYNKCGHSAIFSKNRQHTTLCWKCKHSRDGRFSECEWTRTLKRPVPGWDAIKSRYRRRVNINDELKLKNPKYTYNVFKCPKFKPIHEKSAEPKEILPLPVGGHWSF